MSSIDCGRFIAELRKNKRITQTELADLLKVSNSAISRWETGEGYPDITIFPRLAEILNVSVDELLKGQRSSKELKNTSGNISVRFKNASIGSLVLLLSAFLLFIAITYSTYRVWYGVIGFIMLSTVSCIWFIFSRNYMLEACEYNDEDKKNIFNHTLNFYSLLIALVLLLTPQIVTAADSIITSTVMKLDYYILWVVLIGFVWLSVVTLIRTLHFKKISLSQTRIYRFFNTLEWIVLIILMISAIYFIVFSASIQIIATILPLLIYAAISIYLYASKKDSKKMFMYRMSLPIVVGVMVILFIFSPYHPNNLFENVYYFIALYVIPIVILGYMGFILIFSTVGLIKKIKQNQYDGFYRLYRHFIMFVLSIIIVYPFSLGGSGYIISLMVCTLLFLIVEHLMGKKQIEPILKD